MADHPWEEVLKSADEAIKNGAVVFQKFTCGGCGARNTMDEPNSFFLTGQCQDCGHVTDIKAAGHNYMVIMSNDPERAKGLIRDITGHVVPRRTAA